MAQVSDTMAQVSKGMTYGSTRYYILISFSPRLSSPLLKKTTMTPPGGAPLPRVGDPDPRKTVDRSKAPAHEIPVVTLPFSAEGQRRLERKRQAFVRGPLYLDWIGAAVRCGDSRGLAVLLATKSKADARRETWTKPPRAVLRAYGIGAKPLSRAIAALEQAGLIEVRRRKGRPSLIRLVPWKGGGSDG